MHWSAMKIGKAFFDTYCDSSETLDVVDLGSQNVNGSLADVCPSHHNFIGVDYDTGYGVDVVLDDPYNFPFENDSIDVVVSSSCFEHSQMFWLSFAEVARLLKPGGLFYLNSPSNGPFHRYPTDNWRFYPDAGHALVEWSKRIEKEMFLLESFVHVQEKDNWNDFAAVFQKAGGRWLPRQQRMHRLLKGKVENVHVDNIDQLHWHQPQTEDQRVIDLLTGKVSTAVKERDEIKSALSKTNSDHSQLMAKASQLEEEKHVLGEGARQLENRNRVLGENVQQLEERNRVLSEDARQLENQNRVLGENVQQLEEGLFARSEKCDDLAGQVRSLRQEKDQIQSHLHEMELKYEHQGKELLTSNSRRLTLQSELESSKAEITTLHNDALSLKSALKAKSDQLKIVEEESGKLHLSIDSGKSLIKDLNGTIQEIEEQNRKLSANNEKKQQLLSNHIDQIEQLQKCKEEIQARNVRLREQNQKLRGVVSDKNRSIRKMKDSASWRYTSGFRKIGRIKLLFGGKGELLQDRSSSDRQDEE